MLKKIIMLKKLFWLWALISLIKILGEENYKKRITLHKKMQMYNDGNKFYNKYLSDEIEEKTIIST